MRSTLRDEVSAFLLEHGPARAKEVAFGIRARRDDVDAVLQGDGFLVVERPPGAAPLARYFDVSHRVPRGSGGKSRAAAMLDVLRDGKRHSRAEIFRLTGRFFLTNNAAAELRKAGHDVECASEHGVIVYWLNQPATKPETASAEAAA